MKRHRVTVFGKDFDAMADLVRKYHISLTSHDAKRVSKGGYRVDANIVEADVEKLITAGYKIERHEDLDEAGRERQTELRLALARTGKVETSNLAAIGRYLLVDEVESALAAVVSGNAGFTKLIKLPNKTWEGRECQAIKIGGSEGASGLRPGIFLLGGVHAREWGSPDILINFVTRLAEAYRLKSGIALGNKQFAAADIQSIVNERNIYVFPQANPDGRHHSMTEDPDWRKNRRPAPTGDQRPECIGVDINRNYDFLWDFKKYFDPDAPIQNSTQPCDHDVYIGPTATSEPETKNAVWMLDTYSDIRYFVDLHSYSEDILYTWGDDDNQSVRPGMNFHNPAYDGKRGIAKDRTYREYIKSPDKAALVKLATQMQGAIQAVRGRKYSVMQSLNLYPTAGTSDDYAFSRHIVDATKAKIYSYTVEWGSEHNPTPFHPPYSEMSQIVAEVTSGLLEFCLQAT